MNHYGTLTEALAYHESRGNEAWASADKTDEQRIAALVRASLSLDGQYGSRFGGRPSDGRAQQLAWPRTGAMDHCAGEPLPADIVPVEIERAAYALAALELQTPGASSPSFTQGSINKREQVGSISRERFGPSDGVALTLDAQRVQLAEVEDLLRCILEPVKTELRILRV